MIVFTLAGTVSAEIPSGREWNNDWETVRTQVLEPLDEQFKEQECTSDLGPYYGPFVEKLTGIRGTVDNQSYLLFREALNATTAALNIHQGVMTCEQADWWALIRNHYVQQVDFLGNVFAIMGER